MGTARVSVETDNGSQPMRIFLKVGQLITLGASKAADYFVDDPSFQKIHLRISHLKFGVFIETISPDDTFEIGGQRKDRVRLKSDGQLNFPQTHLAVSFFENKIEAIPKSTERPEPVPEGVASDFKLLPDGAQATFFEDGLELSCRAESGNLTSGIVSSPGVLESATPASEVDDAADLSAEKLDRPAEQLFLAVEGLTVDDLQDLTVCDSTIAAPTADASDRDQHDVLVDNHEDRFELEPQGKDRDADSAIIPDTVTAEALKLSGRTSVLEIAPAADTTVDSPSAAIPKTESSREIIWVQREDYDVLKKLYCGELGVDVFSRLFDLSSARMISRNPLPPEFLQDGDATVAASIYGLTVYALGDQPSTEAVESFFNGGVVLLTRKDDQELASHLERFRVNFQTVMSVRSRLLHGSAELTRQRMEGIDMVIIPSDEKGWDMFTLHSPNELNEMPFVKNPDELSIKRCS
jgi:hypothetical protein